MSIAGAPAFDDPAAQGEAVPAGRRLLGAVQRMMRTGRAMARCVNRIAVQRLLGEDLSRLAPARFNPTLTNAFVLQAVSWTAALRERLWALSGRPEFTPRPPTDETRPRGRGPASCLPDAPPPSGDDDWHDWRELARPWRMGPNGVAVALRAMAGLSDAQVVTRICENLRRAAAELGAEAADMARLAALEAEAHALCPEAAPCPEADAPAEAPGDAPEQAAEVEVPDRGRADGVSGARAAPLPPDEPAAWAGRDPPPPD